jgi:hypothetical protein
VRDGGDVDQPGVVYKDVIPTYGGDTILRIPPLAGEDDAQLMRTVAHKVAEIYVSADRLRGEERSAAITEALKAYEGSFDERLATTSSASP